MKIDEDVPEKLVMKDYNPNQRNLREDGDIGEPDNHDEQEDQRQRGGIPCQTQ